MELKQIESPYVFVRLFFNRLANVEIKLHKYIMYVRKTGLSNVNFEALNFAYALMNLMNSLDQIHFPFKHHYSIRYI